VSELISAVRQSHGLCAAYGSPFVRNLDEGRRYAKIEDFRNFVKLAYMATSLHHSGGTICEPVDLPVNKRHLDMVYSHMKYSDKPYMGSVTHPDRAQDTVEMTKILFGDEYLDPVTGKPKTFVTSLINANSPLTWDSTMLGALKTYARSNQATIVTPFILAGAMSPVTVAGTVAQTLAESLAGMTLAQLVNPGAPVIMGSFASSLSMQSGAPTFGTPEPALVLYSMAALARRLGVPFRSGGALCASKIADAQAAFESANTMLPTVFGWSELRAPHGWLARGGLAMGYEKFMMDVDQAGMMHTLLEGVDLSENGQALDAIREVGPGKHFLGCAHTQANFQTAFYRSPLADNNSFEQWDAEGAADMNKRANAQWKKQLAEYEAPQMDPAVDEALVGLHESPQGLLSRLERVAGRLLPGAPPMTAGVGPRRRRLWGQARSTTLRRCTKSAVEWGIPIACTKCSWTWVRWPSRFFPRGEPAPRSSCVTHCPGARFAHRYGGVAGRATLERSQRESSDSMAYLTSM